MNAAIIVDLFAGGGGASEGIRHALGYNPQVAINHDRVALALHAANHPDTWHLRKDIWEVPPRWAVRQRPVGLLWASPDCKHFSKAKGAAPTRSREIRSLAWVVERWARDVRPRVIILENVEEFKTWGPLDKNGCVIASQKGATFCAFVRRLRRLGYTVEWRELRACDFGTPTIRRRLFLIGRCDGNPIVWPKPTHGQGLLPYRTAAEIIDWDIPCPSIFERKRPLAENTLRRIAEGIRRYVIEAVEPFIVTYYGPKKTGDFRGQGVEPPLPTQTTENRFALVQPFVAPLTHHGPGRVYGAGEPLRTVTAARRSELALIMPNLQRQFGKTALVAAFMAQHNGGFNTQLARPVSAPVSTITHRGTQQQLVTSHLVKLRGTCQAGQAVTEPAPTVTAGGNHIGEVRAFLLKYYGTDQDPRLRDPLHTLTTKDRFGLVTALIAGEPYIITDIGMRMLSPRELFRAQGFPDEYKIDIEIDGKPITKTDQVRCCGNSVCPPVARALVEANMSAAVMPIAAGAETS